MGVCLPGVLYVERNVVLPIILSRDLALHPLRRASQHQVGHRHSDIRAIERKLARA